MTASEKALIENIKPTSAASHRPEVEDFVDSYAWAHPTRASST